MYKLGLAGTKGNFTEFKLSDEDINEVNQVNLLSAITYNFFFV